MTLKSVQPEQAIAQLQFWLDAPWPMSEAEASELASGAGWTVEADGRVYARNNPVEFQLVLGMSQRDTQTVSFSFSLTDAVENGDSSGLDDLKDKFSAFVTEGRERWGTPKLSRGAKPSASWDLGERGGVRIYQVDDVVADFVTPADLAIRKNMNDW